MILDKNDFTITRDIEAHISKAVCHIRSCEYDQGLRKISIIYNKSPSVDKIETDISFNIDVLINQIPLLRLSSVDYEKLSYLLRMVYNIELGDMM